MQTEPTYTFGELVILSINSHDHFTLKNIAGVILSEKNLYSKDEIDSFNWIFNIKAEELGVK